MNQFMTEVTAVATAPAGSTVRTEWGHEIAWPDGHVEYKRDGSRREAELSVAAVRHGQASNATARVVSRTVTTTPWAA